MRRPFSFRAAALVAAGVAVLPFARGLLAGRALYFRDLSLIFHPFRRYALEGLRHGHVWFWDPFVHEGVPLVYLPAAYPVDLLQLLRPDERGISTVLALHVPLAAAVFVILARRLGLAPVAAAAGAVVYALGGFTLSTVNLYVYVQAVAWAPLVVATLANAPRDPRALFWAALATAVAFSTMAVEVVVQAVLIGLVLAFDRRQWRSLARPLAAVILGVALAAPVFLVMTANMAGSGRARGFSVDVVLNQSIHPFTLVQVLIADLYGDLSRLPDRWWGSNFFDRGFPYIVSLYLGAATVALAILGALAGKRVRVWLALGGVALLVALGRWGGMAAMVGWVPESWRLVRFPTKAFFTVHLVTAVLAGFGLDALVRAREAWRRVSIVLGGLGLPLVLLMVWPALLPGAASWFTAHFFPPALAVPTRMADFDAILRDGVSGGTMAVLAAAVALLVYRARLRPVIGAWLVTAIVAADLIRAGAGLNPMVATSWFATSPEVVAAVGAHGVRRVFSCDVEGSREYWEARRLRPGDHEMMTFGASRDTLTPHTNRSLRVETALSADLTSLVPLSRLLPAGVGCADPAALLPWLRGAGVTHVLSLDRMEAAGLHHTADVAPGRISPLHVNLFEVQGVPPPYYVARRVRRGARPPDMPPDSSDSAWIDGAPEDVEGATGAVRSVRDDPEAQVFEVDASRATALVVLDGWFPGWEAAVDGRPVPVLAAGHHRAVWVPAGHARVTFEYHPRGLRAGLALSTVSAILLVILGCGPWRPSAPLTPDRERDLVSVST